ncbi:hypothetical protein BH20ACT13_BH20ACT13_10590 [soil metagenome]
MMRAPAPVEDASSAQHQGAAPRSGVIDFTLHGFVGVRLVGASPRDANDVSKQLGSIQGSLTRDPDIVVRFVDRLPASSDLQYLGLDDAGFDRDSFYVLRRDRSKRMRTRVALEQVGGRCEIVCESGFGSVPLLIPIVNLTMLAQGLVPIHGSAFTYEETGVLVTGWAKGGKTEVLLGFMDRGARYIGDEWVYVDAEGKRLYGIPEPIRIWDWHLDDLAHYRRLIGNGTRARMWLTRRAAHSRRALPDRLASTDGGQLVDRAIALVERQSSVRVAPERLFGRDSCVLEGPLDKVFFVVSHESADVTVEPLGSDEVARRMIFSHQFERLELIAAYLQSRFAFPDRVNTLLEQAREQEGVLLGQAFAGTDAYVVRHPFPAPIPALVDAIRPLL